MTNLNIPDWPDSVFKDGDDSYYELAHTGLPSANKNNAYRTEVKNWKTHRQSLYYDIIEATDRMD